MRIIRTSLAVLFLLSAAASASAQGVKIEFNEGLVTISAQNVPLRTILSEWTRQGGTRIVNVERLTAGTPLTLEFTNASERKVLETLLRSVSGYMLAPRRPGSTTRSSFESILLVPTSVAAARPVGGPAGNPPPQPQAFRPPQLQIPPVAFDPNDPEENPPGDIGPDDPQEDLPVRGARRVQRVPNPNNPNQRQPDPDDFEEELDEGPPASRPNNPFGVQPGSNRPGTITPVPQRPGQNRNGEPPDQD